MFKKTTINLDIMRNLLVISVMLSCGTLFGQFQFQGKLLDSDGIVHPHASIVIESLGLSTETDGEGIFIFENVPSGDYDVDIYIGYQAIRKNVRIHSDAAVKLIVERSLLIDQINVNASRLHSKAPFSHSDLDKEEIEKRNLAQDVPYILRWTPSTVISSDAGTGIGYTSMRIRGSDQTRINVTLNGVPLNDGESQQVFWVDLPDFLSSVESIEIQRGVGTSSNGAGAFGATVDLNTSQIHQDAFGKASLSYGSFNTLKTNLQFGTGMLDNGLSFEGRLSRIHSDGFIRRAEANLLSGFGTLAYVKNNFSIRLNAFTGKEVTYQAWNGVPAQFVQIDSLRNFNTGGTEKTGSPHDNEVDDYTQTHYQLVLNRALNNNLDFNATLHYTAGKGFFEQYKADQAYSDYLIGNEEGDVIRKRWLDNDFYGLVYSLAYTNDDNTFNTTFGGGLNTYKGRHFGEAIWAESIGEISGADYYYDNDAEKNDINFYLKTVYDLDPRTHVFVDVQYRHINYSFEEDFDSSFDPGTQEVQLNFFNPKFGVQYDLAANQSLYASFAAASHEPNRTDYTESSADTRPKHESLIDVELGHNLSNAKWSLNTNLYYMRYNNQLVLTGRLNDVGAYTRTNIKDSYRAGIELELGAKLSKKFELRSNVTLSQNRVKNFTEYIDNWDYWFQDFTLPPEELEPIQFTRDYEEAPLSFSPSAIGAIQIIYMPLEGTPLATNNNLQVEWSTKYISKQYIDNTGNENTVLDAYNFSDLRFSYSKKNSRLKDLKFNLLIRNVLNQKFSSNAWTYRFRSGGYNPVPDDPYARLEGGEVYNLTGFYPQAGINFLAGVTIGF